MRVRGWARGRVKVALTAQTRRELLAYLSGVCSVCAGVCDKLEAWRGALVLGLDLLGVNLFSYNSDGD